jgi:protein-tyrosine kinase
MSRNYELLQQANKAKDLLGGDDFISKASKVAHLRQSEEDQELFKPSIPLTAPSDGESFPHPLRHSHQPIVPAARIVEPRKPKLSFLFRQLLRLPSQTRKLLLQPAMAYLAAWHVRKPQGIKSKIFAQIDSIREEETKLVQRVFLLPVKDAPRAVVFTGVEPGNGCSWICARAAETLAAQVKGTVCVVDANLRSPRLHEYFGLQNSQGLTEALFQSGPLEDYLQQLPGGNLWVLSSGSVPADSHAILTSEGLRSRMKELFATFDYVLIDAPPANLFVDATLLGQLADGIVLVLEANSTRRETARKTKEALEASNLRLLAAVLNKCTFPIPERIYHKL